MGDIKTIISTTLNMNGLKIQSTGRDYQVLKKKKRSKPVLSIWANFKFKD